MCLWPVGLTCSSMKPLSEMGEHVEPVTEPQTISRSIPPLSPHFLRMTRFLSQSSIPT